MKRFEGFELAGMVFDVTAAKGMVTARHPNLKLDLQQIQHDWLDGRALEFGDQTLAPKNGVWVKVNRVKALSESTDLKVPVIAVTVYGHILVIDGWHRVYRAIRENLLTIHAHLLDEKEKARILIQSHYGFR